MLFLWSSSKLNISLQHPPSQSRSEQERAEGDPCSPPTAKKPCTSAWDIISVIFAEKASTSAEPTAESVEDEVFRYMSAVTPSRNTNPLDWWKHHQYLYTRLSNLAKNILCTPSSSTPAERVFSASGLVASQQRAALKPENVDALVFLNKNTAMLFGLKTLGPELPSVSSVHGATSLDATSAAVVSHPLPAWSIVPWEDSTS